MNRGMFRTSIPVVLAMLAAGSAVIAQTHGTPEDFTAVAVVNNNVRSGAGTVVISVDRWSTAAEREKFVSILKDKGPRALIAALLLVIPRLADAHEITPHHGVLFRLSPDGEDLEIIATGLRNPNGLSLGPDDEIYYSDNEGNWVPSSKVTRIVEGGFHGFVPSAHRANLVDGWAPTDGWVKPLIWTPHAGPGSDNSPSQPRVIANPAWPAELQGDLLLTSYGRGTLSLVLMEEVDGQPQGAHMVLPLRFRSGLQQMRFHRDGHLYLVGLTNWSSTSHDGEWGSFHRVRYTGKPLHLPVAVNTMLMRSVSSSPNHLPCLTTRARRRIGPMAAAMP